MNRLTHHFDLLTEAEKRVCNYIVHNYDTVTKMSINDLADKSYTSKTVVINMAQKLGFEGYTDLRYYLKDMEAELVSVETTEVIKDNILKNASMTGNILNYDKLKSAASNILDANTVYIAARGTSKSIANHLSHLLLTMGVKCMLIDDYNLLSIIANQVDPQELFILISLSGETRKIVDAAKIVKARQGEIISLTAFTHNSLARLSDLSLFAATESVETATNDDISRIGFFVICEMLAHQVKFESQERRKK